jgi:hypothetical protein
LISRFRNVCVSTLRSLEQAIFNPRPSGPKEYKMRYVTQVGLCCAMSLGLISVALGQQTAADRAAARQPGAPAADAIGQPAAQPGAAELQPGAAPSAPEQKYINTQPELNRTRDQMHRGRPQAAVIAEPQTSGAYGGQQNAINGAPSSMANGQQRGELGVYMVAGEGRGVEVSRITPGSAAEQAGLRQGDVILQVNGRDATMPQETAQMIRQVPVGQAVSLTVMRDGNRQQVQATMRAARQRREMTGDMMDRDPYRVGFRGEDEAATGGGESTMRVRQLEQQVTSLKQELEQMRQEITQLRSAGGAAGGVSGGGQGLTPPGSPGSDLTPPSAGAGTGAAAPAPGFGAAGSTSTTTSGAGGTSTPAAASTPPATDRTGAAGSTSGTGPTSGAAGSTSGAAGPTSAAAGSTSGTGGAGAAGSTSGAGSSGAAGSASGAGTSGAAGGASTSGSSSKSGNNTKSSNDDLFGK